MSVGTPITLPSAPSHFQPYCVSTSFGSIEPLQDQLRLLLGCSPRPDDHRAAALAFAHAGLPRPGRDLDCHHLVLDCGDAPVLVLAAKHHDCCFYLLVNLADSYSRQALSTAFGFSGLELVMVDGAEPASSYMLAVDDERRTELRETLADHEGFLRSDHHLWLLRLGEVTSRLPFEFAQIQPDMAASRQHHVLVLLGGHDAHTEAVGEALRIALRNRC